MIYRSCFCAGWLLIAALSAIAQEPSREDVARALKQATTFLRERVADHGGYAWVSSSDGKFREGEGICGPGTIWVQPPGTPAVGMAFLDAHDATGDAVHLTAAEAVADALVKGQLRSGGWNYRIEFDSKKRREFSYRDGGEETAKTPSPGGWDVWKLRQHKGNMTTLDDDTTPAALRFLMRIDEKLKFANKPIHNAVEYGLASLINAQYPIGAWSHNYDRFPSQPPDEKHYPVLAASVPDTWSKTWTKDFTGCYMLNDRITQNAIATLLNAYRTYGDKKYLSAAERGGKFLALAQLPDPQPAWAQQYNRGMQPVWDRKFEPPAITGMESQDVLQTLLLLYRETGNRTHLEPIPKALAYLKKIELPGGTLARFYELKTNKPIYFTKDYRITYDKDDVPTHYSFTLSSRLATIEREYRKLLDAKPEDLRKPAPITMSPELTEATRKAIAAMNADGAWLEPGTVHSPDGKKVTPKEGVVKSETFIRNVETLSRYLKVQK